MKRRSVGKAVETGENEICEDVNGTVEVSRFDTKPMVAPVKFALKLSATGPM